MTQFIRICFEFFVLYWVWDETGPITVTALVLITLGLEWLSYNQAMIITLLEENGLSINQMRLKDHFKKHEGD